MRLQDRVCVVTGASSGIGEAVARKMAAEGGRVVAGARSEGAIGKLARAIGGDGRVLDVTDEASVAAFADFVRERHGRADVLVSNAGIGLRGTVEETTVEDWDRQMATNLRGPFLVAKAFLPLLLPERPWLRTILHTASVSGTTGSAGLSCYSASKFGLRGFSQSLALEVADRGVRVVCVNPGYVATPMVDDAPHAASEMAQPDDVAEIYVQLATQPESVFLDEVNVWPRRLYTS